VTEVEAKAMGDSMDAGGGGGGFVAPTHRRGENEPGVRVHASACLQPQPWRLRSDTPPGALIRRRQRVAPKEQHSPPALRQQRRGVIPRTPPTACLPRVTPTAQNSTQRGSEPRSESQLKNIDEKLHGFRDPLSRNRDSGHDGALPHHDCRARRRAH